MTPIQQAALRDTLLIAETLDKRPRPLCRDCADEDGTCPTTGMPCDTKAVFANARAALASLEAAKQEPLTDAQRGPKCWLNRGKCIEPNYCKHPTHCAKNDTRA